MSVHLRFARFILPLAITAIVFELGSQVLNGGIARVPQAVQTLAAYGLAWGLILFLTGPLAQAKELGLVMVDSPAAYRKVRAFIVGLGTLLMSGLVLLALTPLGELVTEGLHGIDRALGDTVRTAIFWLMPFPLLKGLSLFHSGLLLRVRRTALVSYATLSNLGVSIAAVFIMLPLPMIQRTPILLPIFVTYAGLGVELLIMLWGCRRYAWMLTGWRGNMSGYAITGDKAEAARALGLGEIIRFFWPLALIMLVQEFSRPLINLFVSRGEDATAALAVLAVVYTLGRIPYGWLNELRNIPSAFREEPESRARMGQFAILCGIVSFGMMVILFWSPLRVYILGSLIGLPPDLVEMARIPLYIFTFFSIVVTARGYLHGIALVQRRTRALAPSAPLRILAILLSLMGLPFIGVTGAALGITALLMGFVGETLTVWWGLFGRRRQVFTTKAQPTA